MSLPTPAGVAGAVWENIWLAINREDHSACVRARLVERADSPPDKLASAADPVMVVKRSFNDITLLDRWVLVHRQCRTRLPLQEASHLALLLVLVEDLDRDAVKLRLLP